MKVEKKRAAREDRLEEFEEKRMNQMLEEESEGDRDRIKAIKRGFEEDDFFAPNEEEIEMLKFEKSRRKNYNDSLDKMIEKGFLQEEGEEDEYDDEYDQWDDIIDEVKPGLLSAEEEKESEEREAELEEGMEEEGEEEHEEPLDDLISQMRQAKLDLARNKISNEEYEKIIESIDVDSFMDETNELQKIPKKPQGMRDFLRTVENPPPERKILPQSLKFESYLERLSDDDLREFRNKDIKRILDRRVEDRCQICDLLKQDKKDKGVTRYELFNPMNVPFLAGFVNDAGMILGKYQTGLCSLHQRKLSKTVKKAVHMGFFSWKHSNFRINSPFRMPSHLVPGNIEGERDHFAAFGPTVPLHPDEDTEFDEEGFDEDEMYQEDELDYDELD